MRLSHAPAALAAAFILVAAQPVPAQDDALGPMAAQLRDRVGSWCVEARLQFTPEARPLTIAATAESRFLGERWLVTEMRGMDGRGGFHGLGVNGYDPARQIYTGYWIDGTRGFTVPVEGRFDPSSGVFTTRSIERRGNGEAIVVSETRATGPDEETTTFTAPDANGRPYRRMVLRSTRARSAADCPGRAASSGSAPQRGAD